jgi:hypothetical protein
MNSTNDKQVKIMKHAGALFCTLLMVVAMPAIVVHATQITYVSPQNMAKRADLVVRGKVARVESFWNDRHTKIFTRTTIAVDETYKGEPTSRVDILELGGAIDGVKVTVEGALEWKRGEEVLLFLEPYVEGARQVTGFSQGKFDIERDPKTGVAFVVRPAIERETLVRRSAAAEQMEPTTAVRLPLEQFVRSVLGEN